MSTSPARKQRTAGAPALTGDIFISSNGQRFGPMNVEKAQEFLRSAGIDGSVVWCNGFSNWVPASQYPELVSSSVGGGHAADRAIGAPPPPPPPPDAKNMASDAIQPKRGIKRALLILSTLAVVSVIAGLAYKVTYLTTGPEAVVRKYLAATKWEDRLQYVRHPEKVKPLMAEHYSGTGSFSGGTPYVEIQPTKDRNMNVGDWTSVRVVFERGKNGFGVEVENAEWYAIERTPEGYLIDWESSIGYNPMKLVAYKAQMPTQPMKFRLSAKLADYYNYQFRDAKYFAYSIQLQEKGSYDHVYGYIKRDSVDGKKLYDTLKDGEDHPVIVVLHYMPQSPDADEVVIDKFVQQYWNEE